MATIVAIWQIWLFDVVPKFNSCSYTRLILRNIPHWIYLFLILEAIWCFLAMYKSMYMKDVNAYISNF